MNRAKSETRKQSSVEDFLTSSAETQSCDQLTTPTPIVCLFCPSPFWSLPVGFVHPLVAHGLHTKLPEYRIDGHRPAFRCRQRSNPASRASTNLSGHPRRDRSANFVWAVLLSLITSGDNQKVYLAAMLCTLNNGAAAHCAFDLLSCLESKCAE